MVNWSTNRNRGNTAGGDCEKTGSSCNAGNSKSEGGQPATELRASHPRDQKSFDHSRWNTKVSLGRKFFSACVLGYLIHKHLLQEWLLPFGPALEGSIEYAPSWTLEPSNDLLRLRYGRSQRIYERFDDENPIPLLNGPETVLFDVSTTPDGTMYVITEDAKLVQVYDIQPVTNDATKLTARTKFVKDLGMGCPWGGAFAYTKDKRGNIIQTTLYIGDAVLGLTRVVGINDPNSKVEIVASNVVDDVIVVETYKTNDNSSATSSNQKTSKTKFIKEEVVERKVTPILFANDVTVGSKTGMIYFTDSSSIPPDRFAVKTKEPAKGSMKQKSIPPTSPGGYFKAWLSSEQITPSYPEYRWDAMYSAKLDMLRSGKSGSGRLLRYDPAKDVVTVLARGFHFANGIAVVDESTEDSLFLTETFGIRLCKYNLTSGRLEVLVDGSHIPGYLDGADCVNSGTSSAPSLEDDLPTKIDVRAPMLCYTVMPSAVPPLARLVDYIFFNEELNRIVRTMIMAMPKWLMPKAKSFGGLIEVNLGTGKHRFFLDPTGSDMTSFTGVTHYNGKLYLGSLENNYIGVYNIQPDLTSSDNSEATSIGNNGFSTSQQTGLGNDEL